MNLNERWSIYEVNYKKDKQLQKIFIIAGSLQEAIDLGKRWCLLKGHYHVHTVEMLFEIREDIERLQTNKIERDKIEIVEGLLIKEKVG